MRDYPTLHEVLAVHSMLIETYGGSEGVRDPGAAEAALFRPQSGYYHDITEKAAALMESLLINHAFADGNKRVAFAVCHIFLDINGHELDADSGWLHSRILAWIEQKENRFTVMVDDLKSCITQRD